MVQVSEKSKPFYRKLWIQVLIAMCIGILAGHFYPSAGKALKPLGIERFMPMAGGTMNMIGNGIATIIVARWDNALDVPRMQGVLGTKGASAAADSEPATAPAATE